MENDLKQQILKFNKTYYTYDYIYRTAACYFDMRELELYIFYAIREFESAGLKCTQKDLSDILLHPKQSIHSALKSLLKNDYVKLQPSEANKRIKYIYLTPEGKALARRTADYIINAEKCAFLTLSEEEREKLLFLFQKLTSALIESMRELKPPKHGE